MFKKITSAIILVAMVLSLTACSGNKKGGFSDDFDLSQFAENGKYVISEEHVELSMFHPASKMEDGQFPRLREIEKYTNVYARPSIPKSNSNHSQALNLMIASGDMSDLILHYNDLQISKLGSEGAFAALDEHFDIMPNFKKFLDENPEIKRDITYSDGHIYYAPEVGTQGTDVSQGWMIRKDWLDKLGLEVPTNADEFYNVLKAFREKDPNGNGQKDEIPYFDNVSALFGLWGAQASWYLDESGKIHYGPAEPEYKVAIENLAKWYKEGLLSPDIMSKNKERDRLLASNVGGCTHNWFGSTLTFNETLKDRIPGFNLIAMLPPTEGRIEYERRPLCSLSGFCINASSERLEVALKYTDFLFSEKGSTLMSWGVEGKHFEVLEDGTRQFLPEITADPDFFSKMNAEVPGGAPIVSPYDFERTWAGESTAKAWDLYDAAKYLPRMPNVRMFLTGEEVDFYGKKSTEVTTYVNELTNKWILGAEDIASTYDKYLEQLEKYELTKLLEVQQKAFDKRK